MKTENSNSPLRKFFGMAEKIEMALGGICLAALFIVVIIGVFSRILNINTAWYEETTRVFFLWMMWVGVGAGFNHSVSSRVTVLANLLPEILQKICHALYYILNLVMFAVLIGFGVRLAIQQFTMNEMGSALHIPMWIVGICVPVGSVFGFIGVLNTLFFESWRLKTTAEQLEADELAAKTRAEIERENKEGEQA